ncbi:SRPBCC family protein [Muriicola sp. SD30]|uniref:SRPBCC family protein n=1 Tax=Muriicola sp. SD30 TaxID=3240936 RepID=UPI00350FB5F3
MKYITEIVINVPLAEFIRKFDNPENMKFWQKDLISYKVLSGIQGKGGAQMELTYKMGKREIVMIETILKRNLPHEFHATYDAKGVHNVQKNYFKAIDENKTKWISETEFQFNGLFMKVMGFLMPGAFKKQSLKYLKDFKAFAEKSST